LAACVLTAIPVDQLWSNSAVVEFVSYPFKMHYCHTIQPDSVAQ